MKKTYEKPLSEAVRLGLRGEDIADSIGVSNSYATPLEDGDKINGGDALVKGERGAWDTSDLWN